MITSSSCVWHTLAAYSGTTNRSKIPVQISTLYPVWRFISGVYHTEGLVWPSPTCEPTVIIGGFWRISHLKCICDSFVVIQFTHQKIKTGFTPENLTRVLFSDSEFVRYAFLTATQARGGVSVGGVSLPSKPISFSWQMIGFLLESLPVLDIYKNAPHSICSFVPGFIHLAQYFQHHMLCVISVL